MTPERTNAPEAAVGSHAPPGRPPARSGPEGKQELFGPLLEQHQARTADAEGHQEKASPDKPADGSTPPADPAAPVGLSGEAIAAAVGALALTVVPATPPAPVAGPAAAPESQAAAAGGPAAPVLAPLGVGPALAAQQAPAGVVAPVADASVPGVAPAVTPAPPSAADLPAAKARAQQPPVAPPAAPVAKLSAETAAPASTAPAQQPAPDPVQPVAAKQPAAPAADAPAAAQRAGAPNTAPPQPPLSQPPAAPAATPQAAQYQPPAGMRLHQAVETVQAVIRMAQSNGVTRARVALHPEQLGGLEIHLRSTPEGVVARVVADAAQAANVLRNAGEELRRSLESQGLNLVRFDVGTAGGQGDRRSAFGQGEPQGSNGNAGGGPAGEPDASIDTTTETTVQLPNGVLVDVLA